MLIFLGSRLHLWSAILSCWIVGTGPQQGKKTHCQRTSIRNQHCSLPSGYTLHKQLWDEWGLHINSKQMTLQVIRTKKSKPTDKALLLPQIWLPIRQKKISQDHQRHGWQPLRPQGQNPCIKYIILICTRYMGCNPGQGSLTRPWNSLSYFNEPPWCSKSIISVDTITA